jgi:hypothetical protein
LNPSEYLFQEEIYQIPIPLMVVVSTPWHKILEEEKALLNKILGSVKVNTESVAIQYQPSVSLEKLQRLNPGKVLLFGCAVEPEIPPYENTVVSGISVIKADDLQQLDDARKKSLWLALKQMFGV